MDRRGLIFTGGMLVFLLVAAVLVIAFVGGDSLSVFLGNRNVLTSQVDKTVITTGESLMVDTDIGFDEIGMDKTAYFLVWYYLDGIWLPSETVFYGFRGDNFIHYTISNAISTEGLTEGWHTLTVKTTASSVTPRRGSSWSGKTCSGETIYGTVSTAGQQIYNAGGCEYQELFMQRDGTIWRMTQEPSSFRLPTNDFSNSMPTKVQKTFNIYIGELTPGENPPTLSIWTKLWNWIKGWFI